ncbi:hypothetical protein GF356_13565 [candidate division GN15 bacterium]|nr:hypothetical protein [candidate division GN15 bacterium]
MMRTITVLAGLLMLSALALAGTPLQEEQGCPAHRAAQAGHTAFDAFHHAMAPAWHVAWPEKDFEALFAAGPEFKEHMKGVMALKPEFKTTARKKEFAKARIEFAQLVNEYAAACESKDKDKVYELMPKVHDAFEHTASCLLPVHFPEFNGIVITANLILESHLPADNTEGIVGSTETLAAKCESLSEESIPEELGSVKEDVWTDLQAIKATVASMKECCDKKDMDEYKVHTKKLEDQLNAFLETYI